MVLVDADRVKAALGGEFELVHEVVVHVMRAPRVEQRGMDVDPDRGMLLPEIVGQFGVGHQMKPQDLHRTLLRRVVHPSSLTPARRAVKPRPPSRSRPWPAGVRAFPTAATSTRKASAWSPFVDIRDMVARPGSILRQECSVAETDGPFDALSQRCSQRGSPPAPRPRRRQRTRLSAPGPPPTTTP